VVRGGRSGGDHRQIRRYAHRCPADRVALPHAAALGTLMNTRGLMERIVLNIGLDLGVISPTLFAMMVVMALVTTAATAPVLQWLIPTTSTEGRQPVLDPCSR
jgi:Kef-type K+ transport system membrane component KefB